MVVLVILLLSALVAIGGSRTAWLNEALTGNLTQTSYITTDNDIVNVVGAVDGSTTLTSTNQIYRLGDFTSGGNFSFYNQDRTLTVAGALVSSSGSASVESRDGLLVSGAGSVAFSTEPLPRGLTLRGPEPLWLGDRPRHAIEAAVKLALDPDHRFPTLDD